jgi:hypothetical protein
MPRVVYFLSIVTLACLSAALVTSAALHALSIPSHNRLAIIYLAASAFGLFIVGLMEAARPHLRR